MKVFLTLIISTITLIANAQVEISGTANNYNDTVFYIRETGGFQNFTRAWRDNMIKVTIDKKGHFKTTIPETAINTWCIKTDKGTQSFDLIKGKNLELVANFSKVNPLYAVGENADDFNYFSHFIKEIDKYFFSENFLKKIKNKNIDSVLSYRKKFLVFEMAQLNNYKSSHKMSNIYYNWLSSKYSYVLYERALFENIEDKNSVDDATISKILEKGIDDEYAALNTTEFNDLVTFYIKNEIRKNSRKEPVWQDYFNYVIDNNILKGNTRNVYLTRFMYSLRLMPDSLYIPFFNKYDKIVSNEQMKQQIVSQRNYYKSAPITSTINSARAKSLIEIFEKYKGKIIYIDFWGSWCLPCRGEMPNAAALRDKLKGKNIVFLYFGYNDKEKAWTEARNQLNIEGEHYLLNERMKKEADELFGINSIPHYAIIDKEGNVVSKRANRPNDVYEQLLTQIEK